MTRTVTSVVSGVQGNWSHSCDALVKPDMERSGTGMMTHDENAESRLMILIRVGCLGFPLRVSLMVLSVRVVDGTG